MTQQIEIPYTPAKLWSDVIHPGLESHRFSVIVAHRRFGKTVGTVNHCLKAAIKNNLPAPRFAYIAPFRNQAKMIAWSYLKYYSSVIPGRSVNESELFIELPSKHKNREGARVYIIGADHPDSLRGGYWDGVILDEYAQIKPTVYSEIIRPALSDRKGWAVFIGTPKGQNQFFEIYKRAKADSTWFDCLFRADESGLFADGGRYGRQELEDMKKDMTEDQIRQELYCDFTASSANVLIPIDLVTAASEKGYKQEDYIYAPKVMGVDVARFGDDRCTIFKRQGLVMHKPLVFQGIDNMSFAARLMHEIDKYQPDAVFVDLGRGEGVIDRCHQLGYTEVIGVNFGGKAIKDSRYKNKRAEMWYTMKEWLEAGGSLPDVPELKTELSIPEYFFDAANRICLESKDKIKERFGQSPDLGDGAALTFAAPVASKTARQRRIMTSCNTDYDF